MIENVIEFICLKFYLKVLNNKKEYIVKKIENNNFDLNYRREEKNEKTSNRNNIILRK